MTAEDYYRDTYSPVTKSDSAILSFIPGNPSVLDLHNALIDWHNEIMSDQKAFESLDEFRDPLNPPKPPKAQDGKHELWTHLPMSSQMQFLYTTALGMLHEPWGSQNEAKFRVSAKPGARFASSLEIAVLAHRAQIYMTKCVFASAGFDIIPSLAEAEESLKSPIFDSTHRPPPLRLIESPLPCFCLYVSTFNVLSALVPGANPFKRRYTFGKMNEPYDCLEEVRNVVLPTFTIVTKIWKISEVSFPFM
jgi:hypothetical protein